MNFDVYKLGILRRRSYIKEYMYNTSVVKCIWCLDEMKEILEPACGHLRLTMHTNFCRNAISIEYMASAVIVVVFFKLQSQISTHKIMFFSKISSSVSGLLLKYP